MHLFWYGGKGQAPNTCKGCCRRFHKDSNFLDQGNKQHEGIGNKHIDHDDFCNMCVYQDNEFHHGKDDSLDLRLPTSRSLRLVAPAGFLLFGTF